jgi:enoyl-CoA hydratase/carnithine racemase
MSGRLGVPRPLSIAEALDRVRGELDLGLADHALPPPLLVVDVSGAEADLSDLDARASNLPCVLVGVADQPGWAPRAFDVLLCTASEPPAPWVGVAELDAAITAIAELVARSPLASVALVELLRLSEALSVHQAVVAESFVYSTLQAGPEFQAWLACREAIVHHDQQDDPVRLDRHGPVLEIELNRPAVRNALDGAMRDALVSAFRLVEADPTIGLVRLCAVGPDFCSGGDLSEFGTAPDPATAHLVRVSRSVGLALSRCADRVQVEVHGACVGAGIEIPAFARRIVATPDATFTLPEVGFGLIPGAGGTASLPRRIGRHRTAFLALSRATLAAPTARGWGLIDDVVG